MALFAAYANTNDAQESDKKQENEDTSWLNNSSYKIDVTPTDPNAAPKLHRKHFKTSSSASGEEEPETKKRKLKKSKKKKRKKSKEDAKSEEIVQLDESESFTIDKRYISEYKYVTTISRPSAPRYKIHKYIGLERHRKGKFKRYFQVSTKNQQDASDKEILTTKSLEKPITKEDSNSLLTNQEEEISKRTAMFNRELKDEPDNIELWINYVNFQDEIFNFEKSFKKGSIAKGQRVTAERKLCIIDKALQSNPACEELLRLRLNIAVAVFPADELQQQLEVLVERDAANSILWQGFIEATQCSMSHCTAPTVINLYIKCLHTLHALRRSAKVNRSNLEESILRMLYQCGLFLKQAGLFEQLWTLLRMYLELNMSDGNDTKFSTIVATDEKQLEELEEVVLKSQLPMHELWLRVEKLREASHWLPVQNPDCTDPQRLVFSEDVSELIHPITMPGNTIRLTVMILTLLKIPLLPCRHTTMKEFGIDYVSWALDSIETLFPIFIPTYPIDINNKLLLQFAQRLAVGPQYLKPLPGQEEYLQFILTIMLSCVASLQGDEKTAITIWWFRFQQLLVILEREELFKVSTAFKKKLRSDMKSILKNNSSNVALFKEYALVEHESGNHPNAINVLKMAITLSCQQKFSSMDYSQQASICAGLKTFIELHLFIKINNKVERDDAKKECLKYLATIFLDRKIDELPRFITQQMIAEIKVQFSELMVTHINNSIEDLHGVQHFLPDLVTDLVCLNAYFLYLTDEISSCRIFLENTIEQFNSLNHGMIVYRKELLYELLIAILYRHYMDDPSLNHDIGSWLIKYLHRSIELFPNNMFFLAILAKLQSFHSNYGQPWWRIQHLLLQTGHTMSTLFVVLIANQRLCDIQTNWNDTITGGSVASFESCKNRLLNLFKRITRADMCTRRCGLVWRLYLQFLHTYFEPKACRNAYYIAVEQCPWLKALYIDAAIYVPEDLAQIQDLIIEKQLRIHVTPEELEVLRN